MRRTEKFGAFLLQMSPAFSPRKNHLNELDEMLGRLSASGVVVELRNRNWMMGEQMGKTLAYFRSQNVALCLVDTPDENHFTVMPGEVNEVTNPDMAYVRLHGRNAEAYLRGRTVAERFNYDYSDEEIDEVAERAKKLANQAEKVHVIFNNNALDYAPHAALRLRAALRQITKIPPRQSELFR